MLTLLVGTSCPFVAADGAEYLTSRALLGCWRQAPTAYERKHPPKIVTIDGSQVVLLGIEPATGKKIVGIVPYINLCFDTYNTMIFMSFGGWEGMGARGKYVLKGRKISFRSELVDGWFFGYPRVICDLTLEQDSQFRLDNCIGSGKKSEGETLQPKRLENTSYRRLDD